MPGIYAMHVLLGYRNRLDAAVSYKKILSLLVCHTKPSPTEKKQLSHSPHSISKSIHFHYAAYRLCIYRISLLPTPLITWLVTMIQIESFLYEMLCIREGVFFKFCQESDFLSRSQVDDIISFLSCE